MKKQIHICANLFCILISLLFLRADSLQAQAVSINPTGTPPAASAMLDVNNANKGMLIPRISLLSATDVATITSPVTSLLIYNTATAGTFPNNVVPGYYYWNGTKWTSVGNTSGADRDQLIPFSTGVIITGATMVSPSPRLMGFGNNTVETIDGLGESTMPPEAGGFSFVVPFNGTIKNLEVGTDLFVNTPFNINFIGLQYDFTVLVSSSTPNNGIDHPASSYATTSLTTSVRFGFPNTNIIPATFRAATNINTGSITVNAGDRIGIRIRTLQSTDFSASDVTQLSFNASLTYSPF
ncbi:MAG: hypothetical protein ABJB16_13425 [Saprospiraceae bacterium]